MHKFTYTEVKYCGTVGTFVCSDTSQLNQCLNLGQSVCVCV